MRFAEVVQHDVIRKRASQLSPLDRHMNAVAPFGEMLYKSEGDQTVSVGTAVRQKSGRVSYENVKGRRGAKRGQVRFFPTEPNSPNGDAAWTVEQCIVLSPAL